MTIEEAAEALDNLIVLWVGPASHAPLRAAALDLALAAFRLGASTPIQEAKEAEARIRKALGDEYRPKLRREPMTTCTNRVPCERCGGTGRIRLQPRGMLAGQIIEAECPCCYSSRTQECGVEMQPLRGYWHASTTKRVPRIHGHYLAPEEEIPVVHTHRDGQRAHFHDDALVCPRCDM